MKFLFSRCFRLAVFAFLFAFPFSAFAQNATSAKPSAMFPFALPPFDDAKTATDVSWMNGSTRAGANGFIKASGEHFVDGAGNPIRFWGVNLNFNGVFPPKDQAPKIAARLAKFGFNSVRIHHFDGNGSPNGIWKSFGTGSTRLKMPREFDLDQLDRFDFFMNELMQRGIYLNLNMHVGRKVFTEEGFPQASALPDKDKGVDYYDEKLIAAQKEFSSQILTHVNPYTQHSYANEPGVCAVEMSNENSLLGMWLDGSFSKIPAYYQKPLRQKWNDWLQAKYSESTLRAAWTELDDPLELTDLMAFPLPVGIVNPNAPDSRQAIGMQVLGRFISKTDSGAQIDADIDPLGGPTLDGFVRPGSSLLLKNLGNEKWGFQTNRDGLDLKDGQPYTLSFWARSDAARRISVNLWKDIQPYDFLGFTGYADLNTEWQQFSFVFRPNAPEANHVRLNFNFGEALGTVQLSEVVLKSGGRLAAPPNWTLKNGVPLIELKTTQVCNARRDFAQFLGEIESAYVSDMRAFLKTEIGVQCPTWNSQAQFGGWGGLWRERDSDAVDVHAYWKHPIFSAGGWSGADWKVENASMTTAAGVDPLSGFSFYRLKGKPFVMTEWNSGQPNDFGSESLLMIAAYAAWQDWAGIYLFDYHSSGGYDRNAFTGFFSIDSHPAKMATAPSAAMVFRRPQTMKPPAPDDETPAASTPTLGDATVARREYVLKMPKDFLWLEVAASNGQPTPALVLPAWREAGVGRASPLRGKVYVEFGDSAFATSNRADADPKKTHVSDTRQMRWSTQPVSYFGLDTPQSKIATGFLGGYRLTQSEWKISVQPSGNKFVTLALSSLDNENIAQSKKMLLTAVGKAENIGMGWNATRNSVGNNWGTGPTSVEGIYCDVQILTDAKKAGVFALDNTGARRFAIASTLNNGTLSFSISPSQKTVWFEIVAE